MQVLDLRAENVAKFAIDDLLEFSNMWQKKELEGTFNGVVHHPVRNRLLMEAIGEVLANLFLPNVSHL
jgi:NAD dependent epimerase/dehydratase family enzyme